MRNKRFLICLISLFCIISVQAESAVWDTWTAKISAERDDAKPNAVIGEDHTALTKSTPPDAPDGAFKCFIDLYSVSEENKWYLTDIREIGKNSNDWIIRINPHYESAPGESTCTMSWDPDELGHGNFRLLNSYDATGDVVVSDMKSITSYPVTGTNKAYYFRLQNVKFTISDAIDYMKILSGVPSQNEEKVEMSHVIYMLKLIAGLTP